MASPSSHPGSEDEPTVALSTPAPATTSLLVPLAIGALVIVTLGAFGRLHDPAGIAVTVPGFSGTLATKS